MKNKIVLLTIFSIFIGVNLFAQTRTVKGFVFDSETGEPLIGAIIYSTEDSSFGQITNVEGLFELDVPTSIDYLIVSYTGYEEQKMYIICEDCVHKVGLVPGVDFGELLYLDCYFPDIVRVTSLYQEIDLQPIQTNNSTNLLPLLNSLTGVYVHSGALNTNRIIMRGIGARSPFSTRNVKMYYNDIPITSGDGESLMEDLDVSSFDKISVVKGPSGTIQGAPLGGSITLNNHEHFSNTSITSDMSLGSYGLWRNANNLQISLKNASLQLFQNTTLSDGYRENNEYARRSVGMNGIINLNDDHELSFIGHYTQLFGQIPSSINETDYLNEPQKAAFNWFATEGYEDYNRTILGVNHTYDDSYFNISNSVFSNFRNNYEVRPFNILNENVSNFGWRPHVKYRNRLLKELFLTVGAEILFENYEWQTYENENNGNQGEQIANNLENRQYFNIYTHNGISLTRHLRVTAGLNLNHTQYQLEDLFTNDTIDQSGSHTYAWILSPKISVNYFFDNGIQVFGTASHGFSMPSVEETLLPDGLINPDLQPETGWSYEIGSKGEIRKIDLSYEVALYRMNIQNLIVADRIDEDSYVGVNAGATQHDGLETQLAYQKKGFKISANYSLNNYVFKDFIDDGEDYSGNKLTGVPSNTFNGSIRYQEYDKPFYAVLNYRFVDAIPIFDDNSLFTESYQLLDFKMGYDYEFGQLLISPYFGINNLTNEKYASMIAINTRSFGGNPPRIYYPGLPRNVYGGINLRMSF